MIESILAKLALDGLGFGERDSEFADIDAGNSPNATATLITSIGVILMLIALLYFFTQKK